MILEIFIHGIILEQGKLVIKTSAVLVAPVACFCWKSLSTTYPLDVYQPRNPKASAYYKCVENHFKELERAWDEGKTRKVFTALDWLARLTTHIPGRYEQTVRYYGWYSNKSRGMRKKAGTDDTIPAVMPNDISSKESRQNWARLIQKIYEVDHLFSGIFQKLLKNFKLFSLQFFRP